MSGILKDADFQLRILQYACRDRNFLKRTTALLSAEDFKPRGDEGSLEAYWIAQKAFHFWRKYNEPVGGLLKTEMLDYIRENKRIIGSKRREKLLELVDEIRHANGLVAVEAVENKIAEYKERQNRRAAIKEILELEERGEMTRKKFHKICQKALEDYSTTVRIANYEEETEKRISRREKDRFRRYPYLYIDPLDAAVQTIPRGQLGLVLAKYKMGKSTISVHFDRVFAMQGLNVMHVTTEDTVEMVEDRLDASISNIAVKELDERARKLRRRLARSLDKLRGRIKIVDGCEGSMTVDRIAEQWENFRNRGFPVDVVLIDYDEGIEPREHYKSQGGDTRESQEIYRDLKQFAARAEVFLWVLAQTRRGKADKKKMVITGDDAAIDISKVKRAGMCIGIGDGPDGWGEDARHIYIAAHRFDQMRIGWNIMGDFKKAIFYSKERTDKMILREKQKKDSVSSEEEE